MRVVYSTQSLASVANTEVIAALAEVSEDSLCATVETISQPRHYQAELLSNQRIAQWLADELASYGYETQFQGLYRNVLAIPADVTAHNAILVGAHYDSVPRTPGADDNASGVAALLECARIVARFKPLLPVCFVAFNREEDGLLGSADFVEAYLPNSSLKIVAAHVLEMGGYCSHKQGSQCVPQGLPIRIPSVGDFLGILGNRDSNSLVDKVLERAKTYVPELPTIGLKVHFGVEKYLPVLARSDHAPFWQAGIPAVMWTDTAEFRNPNYHRVTDTPDTLDYAFMRLVTQFLLACLMTSHS
jgi:Zn-dependent M28 family amino/carboxypeptidase